MSEGPFCHKAGILKILGFEQYLKLQMKGEVLTVAILQMSNIIVQIFMLAKITMSYTGVAHILTKIRNKLGFRPYCQAQFQFSTS